jgi:LacI family transcriptional regulator
LKQNNNTNVRLEDLARALKLSIATVSRAISDSPRVKAETKKRVKEMAQKMGYRPNQIAKILSSGKTNVIGVIIPRYDEPFFIEVCRGIDHVARKHNYRIVISSSRNSFKFEKENTAAFERGVVDGVIMSFTHHTTSFNHIEEMIKRTMPVVLFDNIPKKVEGAAHVLIDDFRSAYEATRLLINGNATIGFIGGTVLKTVFNKRFDGFIQAHHDYSKTVNTDYILNCKSVYQDHEYREVYSFLSKLKVMPSAFFCSTDNYAMLCIKALIKIGYRVPEDVEVIGFGNLHYSSMFTPELSSVSQPSFYMGEKTAELLISKIERGYYLENQENELILPTKIVKRETTR